MSVAAARARMTRSTFSPASFANLDLWLKADAITGLSDGTAVASWTDASGQGRHATQGTAGARPAYKTGIVNGRPCVRFDGGDWLVSTLTAPAALTFTIVGRRSVGSGAQRICGWHGQASVYDSGAWNYYSNEADATYGLNGNPDNWTIITIVIASTSVANGYRDGTIVGGGWNPKDLYSGATSFAVGAENAAGGSPWNGDVAEVLVYFRALPDSERLWVERYLGTKYGVTVA